MSHDLIFGNLTQSCHLPADDRNKKNSVGLCFDLRDFSPSSVHCFFFGCPLNQLFVLLRGIGKPHHAINARCSVFLKRKMDSNHRLYQYQCVYDCSTQLGGISCCPKPADDHVQALCDEVCPNVFSHSVEQSSERINWCHRAVFFFFLIRLLSLSRWGLTLKSRRIESLSNLRLSSTRPRLPELDWIILWRWAVRWLNSILLV